MTEEQSKLLNTVYESAQRDARAELEPSRRFFIFASLVDRFRK